MSAFVYSSIEGVCLDLLDSAKRKFSVNATSGSPTVANIQLGTSGWIAQTGNALSESLQVYPFALNLLKE